MKLKLYDVSSLIVPVYDRSKKILRWEYSTEHTYPRVPTRVYDIFQLASFYPGNDKAMEATHV